jgi:hypothetical protein
MERRQVKLSEVRFDPKVYPRGDHDPALVQRYAEVLAEIEAGEHFMAVGLDMRLADGRHRQLAYLTVYKDEPDHVVTVEVYPISDDGDILELSATLNSDSAWQLTEDHKKQTAIRLYRDHGRTQEKIAAALHVGKNKVNAWLHNILEDERKQREATIWGMWLACHDTEAIAVAVGLAERTVREFTQKTAEKYAQDSGAIFRDFEPQLYQEWRFAKLTNRVHVFGSVPQEVVDNLLYYYTKPFDVVFDPFGGGGATIDVCTKRLRRYYVSDLSPIPARADIRHWDIVAGLPPDLPIPDLVYLDPPYWKQAEGKYSDKESDLGNIGIAGFLQTIGEVAQAVKRKWGGSRTDPHLALIIGFCKDDHKYLDLPFLCYEKIKKYLTPVWRVQVPYSTEVHGGAFVKTAKEQKEMLYLTRDLMVFGP